jgi:hypothetical protein
MVINSFRCGCGVCGARKALFFLTNYEEADADCPSIISRETNELMFG